MSPQLVQRIENPTFNNWSSISEDSSVRPEERPERPSVLVARQADVPLEKGQQVLPALEKLNVRLTPDRKMVDEQVSEEAEQPELELRSTTGLGKSA